MNPDIPWNMELWNLEHGAGSMELGAGGMELGAGGMELVLRQNYVSYSGKEREGDNARERLSEGAT